MKKNTAGQTASAQVLNTDRTPYNGATSVYVTIDNGTQTIGSVGSGAGTSKGNAEHTYLPSPAETNGNSVKFTFVGTSNALGFTEYATSIQTGDAFARLGAPVNATISADIQAILTTALTESYAADGATGSAAQLLYAIQQFLLDMQVSSTAITVFKLDGSTTAFSLTTNSVALPTTVATIIHRTG